MVQEVRIEKLKKNDSQLVIHFVGDVCLPIWFLTYIF